MGKMAQCRRGGWGEESGWIKIHTQMIKRSLKLRAGNQVDLCPFVTIIRYQPTSSCVLNDNMHSLPFPFSSPFYSMYIETSLDVFLIYSIDIWSLTRQPRPPALAE